MRPGRVWRRGPHPCAAPWRPTPRLARACSSPHPRWPLASSSPAQWARSSGCAPGLRAPECARLPSARDGRGQPVALPPRARGGAFARRCPFRAPRSVARARAAGAAATAAHAVPLAKGRVCRAPALHAGAAQRDLRPPPHAPLHQTSDPGRLGPVPTSTVCCNTSARLTLPAHQCGLQCPRAAARLVAQHVCVRCLALARSAASVTHTHRHTRSRARTTQRLACCSAASAPRCRRSPPVRALRTPGAECGVTGAEV